MEYSRDYVAGIIDHTLLKPDASLAQIQTLCEEAKRYHFASVCVNPWYVDKCADILRDSGVSLCTVIGFPLGANSLQDKSFEAMNAIENGADEIDMVINIGALKSGNWRCVKDEIVELVKVASETHRYYSDGSVKNNGRVIVKVIIETCLLTDEEKVKACLAAKEAGADFVKTSTGFSTGGARVEDVALMRKTVGPDMGVKASGGIRTASDAIAMIEAGADRLGVSAGVAIVEAL